MDIKSLKDVKQVKKYALNIWKDLNIEVAEIKNVNKETFLSGLDRYVISYLKNNYFEFSGRVSRRQYWMFFLYTVLVYAILQLLAIILPILGALIYMFMAVLGVAILIPHIGLAVRRLHDINFSGKWALVAIACCIQFIGILVGLFILFLLALPGDKVANKYGK